MDFTIDLDYLESVARIRFVLAEIVNLLHFHYMQAHKVSLTMQQIQLKLMQLTEEMCNDSLVNHDVVGPAIYLVKLLVRQYGFSYLKEVSKKYQWIFSESFRALCSSPESKQV